MDHFLTPEEFCLEDLFKGRYMIPVYQRPYNWGVPQVKQLLEDIDEAYSVSQNYTGVNSDDRVLFVGTIFIKKERTVRNEYTEYTVVDGQQRITTLTLLLMVLLNRLYITGSSDDTVGTIRNFLWKKENRKNDKEKQVLTLGNIDREIFTSLMNELFAKNDVIKYAKDVDTTNEIEKNLLDNLIFIDDYLNKLKDGNEYYNYIDFITYNIKLISIKIDTNITKLFSIFESINSKGMPLEDIDLIKSYIFQNLNQSDYNEYLAKWGELIKETNDNLSSYLTVYIRGGISYYRNSIKHENFKKLAEGSLGEYYGKESLADVLKVFIDDMRKNVKYYKMLSDFALLKTAGVSEKSVAIFRMNRLADYSHTEPLFFKLLSLRETNISEEIFDEIVEYAFRFILTFQTISSRESKRTMSVFSEVQNEIYRIAPTLKSVSQVDEHALENIKLIFNKIIYDNSINNELLRNGIRNTMTYNKNQRAVKLLLAYLLELGKDNKVDYLKLNAILELGNKIQIDHILPQKPKASDPNFKYYKDGDFMMLKEGQDFTADPSLEKMPYNDFLETYLHKLGNLRLEWADENAKKSNNLIKLEEFDELFNTHSKIKQREEYLIQRTLDSNILISTDNNGYKSSSKKIKRVIEVTSENYKDIQYKNYNPTHFSLFGEERPLAKFRYKQFLEQLFELLYDMEKNRLVELAKESFSATSAGRPYISSQKKDLRNPYTLGNSVYIETNLSPEYIMQFGYKVIEEMGLERKELIVKLEER